MWVIHVAGKEGDVVRAISIFRGLQQMQHSLVDLMAFNILINACASNKDTHRAKEQVEEMRRAMPNSVSYAEACYTDGRAAAPQWKLYFQLHAVTVEARRDCRAWRGSTVGSCTSNRVL